MPRYFKRSVRPRFAKKKWLKKSNTSFNKRVKNAITKIAERKFVDQAFLGNFPTYGGGGVYKWVPPVQGDADSDRIGDKIQMVSVKARCLIRANSLNLTEAQVCRLLLIQWHPDDAQLGCSAAQVFLDQTNLNSDYNVDLKREFTVLYDKRFVITPMSHVSNDGTAATINYHGTVHTFTVSVKTKLRSQQFRAGTTTGMNNLYWVWTSDGTANTPYFKAYGRTRYIDI